LNGVLVIDKPRGWTSHDVVAWARKTLGLRKIGHGGTLDPLATGVLPLYLGEGTKLAPFNLEGVKGYVVTLKLGQETDTLDADGQITAEREVSCTRQRVEEALGPFRGKIRQKPPLYSAVKHRGVPLYRRARAGETPEVGEREAVIHSLELTEFSPPRVTLEVLCGRGTYIRSLGADLGRSLGCGAHVVELRRTRSGKFTLDQALTVEEVSRRAEEGRLKEKILPLEEGVELEGRIRLDEKAALRVRRGQPLRRSDLPGGEWKGLRKGQRWGLFQTRGGLLAIAEAEGEGGAGDGGNPPVLRILRVFQG